MLKIAHNKTRIKTKGAENCEGSCEGRYWTLCVEYI